MTSKIKLALALLALATGGLASAQTLLTFESEVLLVNREFGETQQVHFKDGGQFDKLYTVR